MFALHITACRLLCSPNNSIRHGVQKIHVLTYVFSYLMIFLAIFITVVLPTFIAPFGQNSWQQKQ